LPLQLAGMYGAAGTPSRPDEETANPIKTREGATAPIYGDSECSEVVPLP
jgi:hypothetical protein